MSSQDVPFMVDVNVFMDDPTKKITMQEAADRVHELPLIQWARPWMRNGKDVVRALATAGASRSAVKGAITAALKGYRIVINPSATSESPPES